MRFRFADCIVDADRFELRRAGAPVPVQPKVLRLLIYLLENRARTVTKDEILEAVWPDVATTESSLTRAVSFARAALGESERDGPVIRTVRGRGYGIGVPVLVESAPAEADAAAPPDGEFLCREKELALARDALHEVLRGRGQLLLLVGEAGIGKTRLAAELVALAQGHGALAFWGRCHAGEGARVFWPWVQILRAFLAERGADRVHASLGGGAPEVAEYVPELRERLPELPPPAPDRGEALRRLFEGVAHLLREEASAVPLVLVLDDLHCADEPSLRLLRFVARELAAARMLVVGTYREVAASGSEALLDALAELARLHHPKRKIWLRGLTHSCVRRFIQRVSGGDPSPALVEACYARSEGNPLFLLELLHWMQGREEPWDPPPEGFEREIPEGIRHVIRQRLTGLSAECRGVLASASVLGREFPASVLARVCGLSEDELLTRLEEAETARAVEAMRASPGRLRFTHPLIGETLYDELSTRVRAGLHRRAGEVLEELYTPRALAPSTLRVAIRGEHLEELAHHFHEALPVGDAGKALDYCERAGDRALDVLAFDQALRHYQRALRVAEAALPQEAARRARLEQAIAAARSRSPHS
jgi:predicted ATPase